MLKCRLKLIVPILPMFPGMASLNPSKHSPNGLSLQQHRVVEVFATPEERSRPPEKLKASARSGEKNQIKRGQVRPIPQWDELRKPQKSGRRIPPGQTSGFHEECPWSATKNTASRRHAVVRLRPEIGLLDGPALSNAAKRISQVPSNRSRR